MNLKRLFLLLFVTALLAAPALAADQPQTFRLTWLENGKKPLFTVDVTDSWGVSMRHNKIVGISRDGMVHFAAAALPGQKSFEGAAEVVEAKLAELLTDLTVTNVRKTRINGMSSVVIEGTAQDEKRPVGFIAIIFKANKKTFATLTFVGDPAARTFYREPVTTMANSLRPAR